MLVERELLSVQLVWPVGKMRNRKILFMRCYKILAVSYHILTNLPSWGVHCALGNLELWNFQLGWQFNNNSNKVKKGIICSPTEIICTYWVSRRAGWKNIWLEVMTHWPNAARSVHHEREPNIFLCHLNLLGL